MLLSGSRKALFVCGLIWSACAQAQTVTIPQEYHKLIQSRTEEPALGNDLFGESVNLYTGALEFTHTDVGIRGNNALPVTAARRFSIDQPMTARGQFGDWDLEIPHLHGVFSQSAGWVVPGSSVKYQRCSQYGLPPVVAGTAGGGLFEATEYWHGTHAYLPGVGNEEILKKGTTSAPVPADGNTYPLVTRSGASLRCLPSLASTSSGQGEGFELLAPDGVRYRFDHMASRSATQLKKPGPEPILLSMGASLQADIPPVQPMAPQDYILSRQEVWLLPTLVTDRYGNTVTYTWSASNPWHLLKISSSDGRTLTFSYVTGSNRIASVSDGSRTWNYTYDSGRLASVARPDGSKWVFSLEPLRQMGYVPMVEMNSGCGADGTITMSPRTGTITHPSGAQGAFELAPTRHGKSWVTKQCMNSVDPSASYDVYPAIFFTSSLKSKKLTGLGLPSGGYTWAYQYGPANACYMGTCTSSSPVTKTVSVTDPAGSVTRYTFGNRHQLDEGQMLRVDIGWNGSSALRTEVTTYADPAAGPYPNPVGTSYQKRGDGILASRHAPRRQVVITQQGKAFSWQVATGCGSGPYCFDVFARPTKIIRSSAAAE